MPRAPRIDEPGLTQHVIVRGVFSSLAKSLGFTGAQIARELEKTEAAVIKAVVRGNRQSQIVLELRDQLVGKGG